MLFRSTNTGSTADWRDISRSVCVSLFRPHSDRQLWVCAFECVCVCMGVSLIVCAYVCPSDGVENPVTRALSLQLGKVPALWKTSCLIPVPKKPHPSVLNDFRPVALTPHISKTMERPLLHILRPQVRHALDPLQFAYQEKVGVEDAIVYLMHRAHSYLDKGKGALRIMFFFLLK